MTRGKLKCIDHVKGLSRRGWLQRTTGAVTALGLQLSLPDKLIGCLNRGVKKDRSRRKGLAAPRPISRIRFGSFSVRFLAVLYYQQDRWLRFPVRFFGPLVFSTTSPLRFSVRSGSFFAPILCFQ